MNHVRAKTKIAAGVVATMAALFASVAILITPSAAAGVSVDISNYAFSPAALTVPVGTTVTWTNHDTAPHTVTSKAAGPLNSPTLNKGDSWSFTFTSAGTYEYYCAIHPDMLASVTVTPVSTPPTSSPASTTPTTMSMGGGMTGTSGTSGTTGTSATGSCPAGGLPAAMLSPFVTHVEKGHLQEPVPQQVGDITNVGQYASLHLALIENMGAPAFATVLNAMSGMIAPFVVHVEKGHLEEPVPQQVGDIVNIGQYISTHLSLVETMIAPLLDPLSGNC